MFTIDEINSVLRRFAIEDAEKRMAEYADLLEEEHMYENLLKEHEMLRLADLLEDFSPFDTCNS
jgi:hypothetical protein